jgi:Zn-dependent protease with chaperone function
VNAVWPGPVAAYLWQAALHSWVMGVIYYTWAHRIGLPSGRTKRRLLATLLVLPLVTPLVPGRTSIAFAERSAWLNSARVLAVPLPFGFHVSDVLLAVAVMTLGLTFWQEVLPALRRTPSEDLGDNAALVIAARRLPGWERIRVGVSASESTIVVTSGVPGRPRLIVSRGALEALAPGSLDAVMRHEHAHWQAGGWYVSHALFAARLVQAANPAALWAFREYCVEQEIGCDATAVAGSDRSVLARVLLRIYEETDRGDVAARSTLRKRVDLLLDDGPEDAALPPLTVAAAAVVMALVLPWIV